MRLLSQTASHTQMLGPGLTRRALVLAGVSHLLARATQRSKFVIAHRGASAYAPENTLAAYRLAVEQGADFVEQDLQITRDGVLVCLHDRTLERTTDVATVFADRARTESAAGRTVRQWLVHDFNLDELRRLDAGSWFDSKFRGERIPTWDEAIQTLRGRAGLYPELKDPEHYAALGYSMEELVWETLCRHRLQEPGADPKTPVVIQSFSDRALRNLRKLGCRLPLTLLIGRSNAERWLSQSGMREIRSFAEAIGPEKTLLLERRDVVARAHALGLTVVPYTFRSTATGKFPDVRSEMAYFLFNLRVDGLFTDNPDLFPRSSGAYAGQ